MQEDVTGALATPRDSAGEDVAAKNPSLIGPLRYAAFSPRVSASQAMSPVHSQPAAIDVLEQVHLRSFWQETLIEADKRTCMLWSVPLQVIPVIG